MKKSSAKITQIWANKPVLCSIIVAVCWFIFSAFEMYHGSKGFYFLDTDCYTRYLRIIDWLSGDFSWFEKIFPFTNCPYGEVLHFTRINDVLWLVFSLPFLAFLPLKGAIYAGGMIFSPLLFILTLALLLSGIKKFVGAKDFYKPSLFIFVFSFIFLLKSTYFSFGRPDHHSLMLLITTFLSVNLLQPSAKKMFISGLVAAVGIWASSAVEGMFLAYSVLAVLCVGVFFYQNNFKTSYKYVLGLFIGVLSAYLLNPPFEGYLSLSNSRLSLIHVVICAFTLLVFYICKISKFKNNTEKFCFLISGAALSLVCLIMLFGYDIFFAPIISEKILYIFTDHITENSYSLPVEDLYLILGSLEILLLFRYFKLKSFGFSAVFTLFFIYLPVAAFVRRFLQYEILFYVIITAFLLVELFKLITKADKYKWLALGIICLNLLFAFSFTYASEPTRVNSLKLQGCALSDIFFAPQLVYITGTTTIASPYHNNVEGISDTIAIFSETDEKKIQQMLKKRGVKYVIIPDYELAYLIKAPKNSFYKQLFNGHNFNWLKPLNDQNEAYRFYEIIR